MTEHSEPEQVSVNEIRDGDRILTDEDDVFEVGDYITWEVDGVHIEGLTDGNPVTRVFRDGQLVRRLR